jgi:hypothetical protein
MTTYFLPLLLMAALAGQGPERVDYSLAGTIGTLPVRITLAREGDRLSGTYTYETGKASVRAVTTMLSLEGTIDGRGRVELVETVNDASGETKTTGRFTGTLTGAPPRARFEGTWTKPGGGRPLAVSLSEVATTPGGLRVVVATMRPKDPSLAEQVSIRYPRLEGDAPRAARFNEAVEPVVAAILRDFEELAGEIRREGRADAGYALDLTYEMARLDDSVASVALSWYTNAGGAHPSTSAAGVTVDLGSGRVVLDEIFADRASFRMALAIRAERAALGAGEIGGLIDTAPEAIEEWYLTPRGLVLILPVPHVAGDTAEVFLPTAEIEPLLSARGKAWLTPAR